MAYIDPDDPVGYAFAQYEIKWGNIRNEFNSWRTRYSKESVKIIVEEEIRTFRELPASVMRDLINEALTFIDGLGDNFFHGDE